jgi:hypothetical protein
MNLCTPATIYLVLSAIGIIMIAFQNYGMSPNMYCVGNVQCPVQSSAPIFIMKILYVTFWTFILNTLCSYGYNQLAWFLLLLPFILFFIMIFMVGTLMNKRTTSTPPSSSSSSSSSPFYQQQVDAQSQASQMQQMQSARMRRQDSDNNVAPPGSEQDKWFSPSPQFAGNQYNADGSGGQYSSYSDYDHSLDQRTKQAYKESREGDGKNVHYK